MKTNKEYKIETLEQLGDIITPDNLKEILTYLEKHFIALLFVKSVDKDAKSSGFTWIDDGKNDVEVIITNK
jgi:hypothetical protein